MATDIKSMSHSERLEKLKEHCKGLSAEGLQFLNDFLGAKGDDLAKLRDENDQLKRERGSLTNAPAHGSRGDALEAELYKAIGDHADVFKSLASSTSQTPVQLFNFETRSMTIGSNLTGDPISSYVSENIQRPSTGAHFSKIIGVTESSTGSVSYMQESSPLSSSGSFGFQAEGQSKAEIAYNATVVTAQLEFLAATCRISRQFLASIPDLQRYVSQSLSEDFQNALDVYVYQRLTAAAVAGVSSATVPAEKLLDYVVQLGTNRKYVSHICLSASSWGKILKSQPGSNQPYSIPGGFQVLDNGATFLFGIPLVPIPAMPSGSVLAGNFSRSCSIARNTIFGIRTSDEDGDNFSKNMVTIRGESLLALMIFSPGSFISGTI